MLESSIHVCVYCFHMFTNCGSYLNTPAQLLGYKSFMKIVYTFTICYGHMDDHAVKHRTNLTWHICIGTVRSFLFSILYLVYLKHAWIVYTCMCVLLSHVYKLWVILKYACSSNQVNIYACVSYKGGRLQLWFFFIYYWDI
jgi:hypothetical protein